MSLWRLLVMNVWQRVRERRAAKVYDFATFRQAIDRWR